jgi:hypothetical protein
MFFKVHILYIEEGMGVYEWSEDEKMKNREMIEEMCNLYNFTYTIIPLERVFDLTDIDLLYSGEVS